MNYALIVAGGSGSRMNSKIPKQFVKLGKIPILMRTIHNFHRYDDGLQLVIVLPEDQHDYWFELCHRTNFHVPHVILSGGQTRFQSVKNGLEWIFDQEDYAADESLIAIHDGVRPLCSPSFIEKIMDSAKIHKAVIPGCTVADSVRILGPKSPEDENQIHHALDRNQVRTIQTPQVFLGKILQKAYQQPESTSFTDDASVVEKTGTPILLVEGDPFNIKITFPIDLTIAMTYLRAFDLD